MATPLFKKLGIKDGMAIAVFNYSQVYSQLFNEFPSDVIISYQPTKEPIDLVHIFVSNELELDVHFKNAKSQIKTNGVIWVSWPKKSSGIPSSIDKFDVINYGLSQGLVDTKVAAINDIWSGHKFVIRLENRPKKVKA